MAHISLQADDFRVFIKNGKLRFQAWAKDEDEVVMEQVTISFPLEMQSYFENIKNYDENKETSNRGIVLRNRISDLTSDN